LQKEFTDIHAFPSPHCHLKQKLNGSDAAGA
jgi:hypothetical protein